MKTSKKEVILTPEQIEAQKKKDQKKLEKLQKMKSRSKPAGYLAYFIFFMAVIYMADEVTTQISTLMKSVIASQIFAPIVGADVAVARMSAYSLVAAIAVIAVIFYRPLSDKYGRKPFLFINTLGMGLGLAIIGTAKSIPQYLLGYIVTRFVIPNDIQAVYIYETAPAKHRAKYYSMIKAFATLSIVIVPMLRNYFIPGTDLSNWRGVFIVPGILILAIAVLAFVFVRESDAYIDNSIRQLTMTEAEKEQAKASKSVNHGGLINGFRYVFSHKQLIYVGIVFGLVGGGTLITSYYEVNMLHGYARQFVQAGQSFADAQLSANNLVNMALMMFPFGSAIVQAIQGFVSDGLGRKKGAIVMTATSLVSFVLCNVGANLSWHPLAVGFLTGISVGSYWAVGDIIALMRTELVPTHLRQSVYTPSAIMGLPLQLLARVPALIIINVLGDSMIPMVTFVVATITMGLAMIVTMSKIKETQGIDINAASVPETQAEEGRAV